MAVNKVLKHRVVNGVRTSRDAVPTYSHRYSWVHPTIVAATGDLKEHAEMYAAGDKRREDKQLQEKNQ